MQRRHRANERRKGDLSLPSRFHRRKGFGKSLAPMVALSVSAMAVFLLIIIHSTNQRNERAKKETFDGDHSIPNASKQRITSTIKPGTDDHEQEYHLIFSTGCSLFQDWQSYVFFFHALKSGQKGRVTRIASGCRDEDIEAMKQLHKEQIEIMSDRFYLHLTPEFATVKPGLRFKYFNKPFGVRHWMEHVLGFPDNPENSNAIVILVDPDQILLRPFTNDFTNSSEVWRPTPTSSIPMRNKVEHGSPFAQQYGFGLQWKTKVNMTHVAGGQPSRIDGMDMDEARMHYSVGPPYIATAKDMYAIVEKWTEFVPLVYDNYPHLLAEMFAYCLAAAHLNLPHRVAYGFMVSDTLVPAEGWQTIDTVNPKTRVCKNFPQKDLPHVLHYCQRYSLGKWYISKYKLRKDFISCDAELLMEPSPDIVNKNYQIAPEGTRTTVKTLKVPRRMAFMICTLIQGLNEAATFFKDHHCERKAVYTKSYIFHDNMEE